MVHRGWEVSVAHATALTPQSTRERRGLRPRPATSGPNTRGAVNYLSPPFYMKEPASSASTWKVTAGLASGAPLHDPPRGLAGRGLGRVLRGYPPDMFAAIPCPSRAAPPESWLAFQAPQRLVVTRCGCGERDGR